jgi:ferredoxin
MAYVICEPCVGVKDRACVDVCPVSCIYELKRTELPDMLFIHPVECIDCGICVTECPVEAIYPEDDVPEQWHRYIEINREAFKQPA